MIACVDLVQLGCDEVHLLGRVAFVVLVPEQLGIHLQDDVLEVHLYRHSKAFLLGFQREQEEISSVIALLLP